MIIDPDRYYGTTEAARLLGVSACTVLDRIKTGVIKHVHRLKLASGKSGHRRIPGHELIRVLRESGGTVKKSYKVIDCTRKDRERERILAEIGCG